MLKVRVIPCLLLKNRSLVKTICFREVNYIGEPLNVVRIFNEKEVDELVLLDITATIEKKEPNYDLITEIATECYMPFSYGGGIRNLEMMRKIFNSGVEKIIINSYAIERPEFIQEAATKFGSQSIVVSIDVRKNLFGKYIVYSYGGRENSGLDPVRYARHMEEMGAGEILLTSMERDGTWAGYDHELVKDIATAVNIPVIASGGAGKVSDFAEAVGKGKASAVAIGSMAVYHSQGQGVLINFPDPQSLEEVFK